jgi:hypothetical protein
MYHILPSVTASAEARSGLQKNFDAPCKMQQNRLLQVESEAYSRNHASQIEVSGGKEVNTIENLEETLDADQGHYETEGYNNETDQSSEDSEDSEDGENSYYEDEESFSRSSCSSTTWAGTHSPVRSGSGADDSKFGCLDAADWVLVCQSPLSPIPRQKNDRNCHYTVHRLTIVQYEPLDERTRLMQRAFITSDSDA